MLDYCSRGKKGEDRSIYEGKHLTSKIELKSGIERSRQITFYIKRNAGL